MTPRNSPEAAVVEFGDELSLLLTFSILLSFADDLGEQPVERIIFSPFGLETRHVSL